MPAIFNAMTSGEKGCNAGSFLTKRGVNSEKEIWLDLIAQIVYGFTLRAS